MIDKCGCFWLEFEETENFELCFGEITVVRPGYDPYQGPYEVIPKFEDIILKTKNKNMEDDVTVHEIPVAIVENLKGGNTVTIGG